MPDSEGWCASQCHTLIVPARLCHLLLTSRSVTTYPLYRFFVTGIITCHSWTLGICSDIWCSSRLPFIAQSHFLLNFLATFALSLPLPLSRVSVWASSIPQYASLALFAVLPSFKHCCEHPDLCYLQALSTSTSFFTILKCIPHRNSCVLQQKPRYSNPRDLSDITPRLIQEMIGVLWVRGNEEMRNEKWMLGARSAHRMAPLMGSSHP